MVSNAAEMSRDRRKVVKQCCGDSTVTRDLTYVLSKQLMYSVMLYMTASVQYFLKCLQVFVAIYLCNIYSDGAVIVYFSCSNITEQIARAV